MKSDQDKNLLKYNLRADNQPLSELSATHISAVVSFICFFAVI